MEISQKEKNPFALSNREKPDIRGVRCLFWYSRDSGPASLLTSPVIDLQRTGGVPSRRLEPGGIPAPFMLSCRAPPLDGGGAPPAAVSLLLAPGEDGGECPRTAPSNILRVQDRGIARKLLLLGQYIFLKKMLGAQYKSHIQTDNFIPNTKARARTTLAAWPCASRPSRTPTRAWPPGWWSG